MAVPNDASNQARALVLLQSAGLVELKSGGSIFSDLADIDTEASRVQVEALDAALSLFDGDTPRHERRRTRAATLELADLRLTAVRAELSKFLGPGSEARIELRPVRSIIIQELYAGGHVVITPRRKAR